MKREGLIDLALLGGVIFAWSTSWIAMKAQTGTIAPEVSVFWRFLISAPLTFLWAAMRGSPLHFPLGTHLRFVTLGMLIFSTNFILFYYGSERLPSGLMSVVFSLTSIVNLVLARVIFGDRISGKVALGGLIGFAGVALLFLPEIAKAGLAGPSILAGLGFCVAGTMFFCSGNMLSTQMQRNGLPVIGATAWGMVYGTLWAGALALAGGKTFTLLWTWPYLGGLLWLSIVSTVAAYLTYLTLLGRIGAARAGYSTVLLPVFALIISAIFESYQFTMVAFLGLGLVALGNILVLRR